MFWTLEQLTRENIDERVRWFGHRVVELLEERETRRGKEFGAGRSGHARKAAEGKVPVVVLNAVAVPDDWNARFSANRRAYRFRSMPNGRVNTHLQYGGWSSTVSTFH